MPRKCGSQDLAHARSSTKLNTLDRGKHNCVPTKGGSGRKRCGNFPERSGRSNKEEDISLCCLGKFVCDENRLRKCDSGQILLVNTFPVESLSQLFAAYPQPDSMPVLRDHHGQCCTPAAAADDRDGVHWHECVNRTVALTSSRIETPCRS